MISDWNDLQTVLAIAKTGSLSAASRHLHVSQSTVSRRLQSIEAAVNGPVFYRGAGGELRPTEAGSVMIAAAERMQAAFSDAVDAMSGRPSPVRLASCEVVAKAVLMPALAAWARDSGQPADLAVHDDLFALPDDAFDILVTPLESAPADMVGRRIRALDWGLFAAPVYLDAHPVLQGSPDLAGCDVIAASGSLGDIAAYRWFAGLGGRPVFSASSPAAQQDAAASGMGIALLPAALARSDPRLVEIDLPGTPTSDVWMVSRRADANQPRIAAFLRWARRHFDGKPADPGGGRDLAAMRARP